MKPTRPFRAHEVYASPCVDCKDEVESVTFPVPLRCAGCQAKRDKSNTQHPDASGKGS